MNLRDLFLRIRALVTPNRVEHELDEELAFHIARETEKHIAAGLSPIDARTRAIARFGPVPLAADQCRDARGTGVVDDLRRDIGYAFRTFRRSPLAALTIVATVALGLGLVAAVFTLFNAFFFHVDAVRNPGELFGVERQRHPVSGERTPFTRSQYEAMRRETTVFSDAVAVRRGIGTRLHGRAMNCTLVTGNFFQVLGVHAALGRVLTPADEERFAGRPVIVLSHRGWSRLFARDPAVIGRTVLINGFRYEIVGVAPEGFRGLVIGAPDYWAPFSLAGQFRSSYAGKEDEIGIEIVGRIKAGLSPETAAAGLTAWASGQSDPDRSGTGIRLKPRQGTVANDAAEVLLVFVPLFFAFGLILLIGCANVANLLLARGVSRQREIGLRLSLGASRRRIVRQLLTESLLLALASAACGLAISRVVLEATLYAAATMMPAEMAETFSLSAPGADWRVLMFLLSGAIASTAFFGLAPALQATRLELVRTMRGEMTRDARPSRARNALIAAQVGTSALLLICAAIFLRSAFAASSADPGLRTVDTLFVEIGTEPLRAAVVSALGEDPAVAALASSHPGGLATPGVATATASKTTIDAPARDMASSARQLAVGYRFVSPEYFGVVDIPVLRGRGFTQSERSADAPVAVVSETAARQLWPDGGALGQVLHVEIAPQSDTRRPGTDSAKTAGAVPFLPSRTVTVVGIVRDVQGFRLAEWPLAGVYLPTGLESAGTTLTVRVHGDPDQARTALLERLTLVDPAINEIMTPRMLAGVEGFLLRIAFSVTVVLAGLALVLTLSGLFSVLSYVVEQRTKEIGVRMALGATRRNVIRLVISQLLRQVSFGLITGGGLAAALAIVLMSTPAASYITDVVHVFDPLAYVASALCIVTACVLAAWVPARRAARIDPIAALRQN